VPLFSRLNLPTVTGRSLSSNPRASAVSCPKESKPESRDRSSEGETGWARITSSEGKIVALREIISICPRASTRHDRSRGRQDA